MRNPVYLNKDLLINMSDFYGIDIPEDSQVTRKVVNRGNMTGGVDKVIKATKESEQTSETTQVYESRLRPVRLLNDVIDELLREEQIIDLTEDIELPLIARKPILLEGQIQTSPASVAAQYFGPLISQLIDAAKQGVSDFNDLQLDQSKFFEDVLGKSEKKTIVNDIHVEGREETFIAILNENYLVTGELEDAQGELTAFGLIQKVVRPGSQHSLERYLFPGLNRGIRRMIPDGEIDKTFDKMPVQIGATKSDIYVEGPAAIVDIVAIFA